MLCELAHRLVISSDFHAVADRSADHRVEGHVHDPVQGDRRGGELFADGARQPARKARGGGGEGEVVVVGQGQRRLGVVEASKLRRTETTKTANGSQRP